ncbi:uncharacterized protein J3D65DRAFT_666267 [Phyllosticta citribraziliensis]|uniref:MYND-type domain-containing protein n=1 Tax=Phyllosticta citribraziliensis TaxID=989973 RepID=A0ABR1LY35_9PEZI
MSAAGPPQDGLIAPTACPCANNHDAANACTKAGTKACAHCFLVLYCSHECQVAHWRQHKTTCKSQSMKATWIPDPEPQEPVGPCMFGNPLDVLRQMKHLWGNIPAIDVLKLEQNEGPSYGKDIGLLFAASGDLRNVIKSFEGIQASSPQSFTAVVNDREFHVVARNTILLLTAMYVDSASAAAEAMLHIWYSALIPSSVLHHLRATVLPHIRAVCQKIAGKPAGNLFSKTFTNNACSLRMVLEKRFWDALPGYLEPLDGLTADQAQRVRLKAMRTSGMVYQKDSKILCCQLPGWRTARIEFRKDGVVAPFGASKAEFNVPNPTLFREQDEWSMPPIMGDPIDGWSLRDILKKPLAKNDIYGGMFFYVQDLLKRFCTKIQALKIDFVLLHNEANDLPKTLANDPKSPQHFDRIETSNLIDPMNLGCLGLGCLKTFAPLLRPVAENPHATLVTFFQLSLVTVMFPGMMEGRARRSERAAAYFPPGSSMLNDGCCADCVRRNESFGLFEDFDKVFKHFKSQSRLDAFAKRAGLRSKRKHTIIEPWALRLPENATQAEFDVVLASPYNGEQRYVEWQKVT